MKLHDSRSMQTCERSWGSIGWRCGDCVHDNNVHTWVHERRAVWAPVWTTVGDDGNTHALVGEAVYSLCEVRQKYPGMPCINTRPHPDEDNP